MVSLHRIFLANEIPVFKSLILLDPFLLPGKEINIPALRTALVLRTRRRQDTWKNRQEAFQVFRRRWEERVVRLYVVGNTVL